MDIKNERGLAMKVVLAMAVVLFLAFLATNRDEQPEPEGSPAAQVETWRCHACARISGKAWTTCKTLMASGTERDALLRVKERVCTEAPSEDQCNITQAKCKKLDSAFVRSAATKSSDGE